MQGVAQSEELRRGNNLTFVSWKTAEPKTQWCGRETELNYSQTKLATFFFTSPRK